MANLLNLLRHVARHTPSIQRSIRLHPSTVAIVTETLKKTTRSTWIVSGVTIGMTSEGAVATTLYTDKQAARRSDEERAHVTAAYEKVEAEVATINEKLTALQAQVTEIGSGQSKTDQASTWDRYWCPFKRTRRVGP